MYGSNVEVDYRGYEVTVENFMRVLTGSWGGVVVHISGSRSLDKRQSHKTVAVSHRAANAWL